MEIKALVIIVGTGNKVKKHMSQMASCSLNSNTFDITVYICNNYKLDT